MLWLALLPSGCCWVAPHVNLTEAAAVTLLRRCTIGTKAGSSPSGCGWLYCPQAAAAGGVMRRGALPASGVAVGSDVTAAVEWLVLLGLAPPDLRSALSRLPRHPAGGVDAAAARGSCTLPLRRPCHRQLIHGLCCGWTGRLRSPTSTLPSSSYWKSQSSLCARRMIVWRVGGSSPARPAR